MKHVPSPARWRTLPAHRETAALRETCRSVHATLQAEHPGVLRVADVGAAAGKAWQALPAEAKTAYEEQSRASKVQN